MTDDYFARRREAELADLREHWGEAYAITYVCGWFHAARLDNGKTLRRETAEWLRAAIHADYFAEPVPRMAGLRGLDVIP